METTESINIDVRRAKLHALARGYVTEGLGKKNFDAIPYHDDVVLRAPIAPGGSSVPLVGRETLRMEWWAPLPDLLGEMRVIDSFVNHDLTAVVVEFHLRIINPACSLRIADRFRVNAEGEIVEQENFFDPRAITNPGS